MPDRSPNNYTCHVIVEEKAWNLKKIDWESYISSLSQFILSDFDWDRPVELNVKLTNDAEIQQLNRQFRGKDKPTNVLSFPAMDETEIHILPEDFPIVLGDIALALETIEQEAIAQSKLFEHHVSHLVIHGILHLLGYDHETDSEAEEMEALEVDILKKLSISNPYKE